MKHITLSIEESKYKAFLSLIQSLDYVSIADEIAIPLAQQEEVENRLKLIQSGEMQTRSWEEAEQAIFKR